MAILTPNQPKYFKDSPKKDHSEATEILAFTRSNIKKNGEKRDHGQKIHKVIQNGLCKIGRQLLGPQPVPLTIQDAKLKLYLHLVHGGRDNTVGPPCPLCEIPNRVALNSPKRDLEKKLTKLFGENLDQKPKVPKISKRGSYDEREYRMLMSAADMWHERKNPQKENIALEAAREVLLRINEREKTLKVLEPSIISENK